MKAIVNATAIVMVFAMSNNKKIYILHYPASPIYDFIKYYIAQTSNIDVYFELINPNLINFEEGSIVVCIIKNPIDSIAYVTSVQHQGTEFTPLLLNEIRFQLKSYSKYYEYFDKNIEHIVKEEDVENNIDKFVEFLCGLVNENKNSTIENPLESFNQYSIENAPETPFCHTVLDKEKTEKLHNELILRLNSYDLENWKNLYFNVSKKAISFT